MSCRIIGRLFDRALFCESLRLLQSSWPFDKLRATFVPTPKNKVVSGLWKEYGLSRIPADGAELYAGKVSELRISFPDVIQLAEHL